MNRSSSPYAVIQHGQAPAMHGSVMYPNSQQSYMFQPEKVYETYQNRQSRVLGVLLVVSGILGIIISAASIGLGSSSLLYSSGFVVGKLAILTGAFGIAAASTKTPCKVITFLVLSVVVSIQCLGHILLGASDAIHAYTDKSVMYSGYGTASSQTSNYPTDFAMGVTQVLLGLIIGILCIWGSALGCKVACCFRTFIQENGAPYQYNRLQDVPLLDNHQMA